MFCCTLLYVHSNIAIILMGKRELVALLSLSSWCLVVVLWLFFAVPWVCLQFVIVVFPDHTLLLFLRKFVGIARLAERLNMRSQSQAQLNMISKYARLIFYLSVYPQQTSNYHVIFDFCVDSVSLATLFKKCNVIMT